MSDLDGNWALDKRLRDDTIFLWEDELRTVLLMNDKRWPWVIIVPKISGAEELSDLGVDRLACEMQVSSRIGDHLKAFTACAKINTAAIGNMVRQLHIHVIARSPGDANWPGPVWGFGEREEYIGAEGQTLAAQLSKELVKE